jgi:hypothetical protein
MNLRLRSGKASELRVAAELIRHGLDAYLPCVDDQGIDLIVRVRKPAEVRYYDVQVKSVKGYNRIVGLTPPAHERHILIIHYRHDTKPDEFFYLTPQQIAEHHLKDSPWKDLVFNAPERDKYQRQTLAQFAEALLGGSL